MLLAVIGLATLTILWFDNGEDEPSLAANAEPELVVAKVGRVSPRDSAIAMRPLRVGEIHGSQEEDAAGTSGIVGQVKEGTSQSKSELEWDRLSSTQRRTRVAEAIAQELGNSGANPLPAVRAELAHLLAAARADFFATKEGRAQFVALEARLGE